jgi:2-dehydro-3-deoxygluconokinase
MPPTRYDIVAMGEAMVEFNQTTPGQSNYLQGFGGDTSNAIIAAARAGARCSYVTAVGNDSFGQSLLQLWREELVDNAQAAIDTVAPTGLYFVTHGAAGHEFSYLRTGSAAAVMILNDAQRAAIISTKVLHLSGISLAISALAHAQCLEAIRMAKVAGVQISFDPNLRLKLWSLQDARAAMLPVIAQCDIFLPSLDDVVALSGLSDPHTIVEWCHQLGAKAVFLKLGAQGVLVSHQGQRNQLSAHAVQAVDATGAGDCFAGNLLARLCAGDDALQSARYANAAAALAVQGFGAVAPLPKPAAVQALLASEAM